MLPEKIKKFYETRVEYFKKKEEIARAMCELDLLLMEANQDLKNTVDHGLDDDYLIKVSKAYSKHKFNSKIVCEFLDKIDNMFFKDLEPELKDTLEVVSINIDTDYGDNWNDGSYKTISGPILIDIHSSLANRLFRLSIPIKSAISTDMIHWTDRCDGMYIVKANSICSNKSKDICRVFDQSKIVEAVRKYLKGEFDHDLDCEVFSIKGKAYSVYRTLPYVPRYSNATTWSCDDDYSSNVKYIEVHDLFNDTYVTESRFNKFDDIVPDCICDIEDFDANEVDS